MPPKITPIHGGKRPGAGRKPVGPRVRLQVRVSPEVADWLYTEARTLGSEDIARGIESAAAKLALDPDEVIPYIPLRGRTAAK